MSNTSTLSESTRPGPKKLVICCDGTWQSSTSLDPQYGTPSNVARLSRILANSGSSDGTDWQQAVYYDAGVGTGDLSSLEKKRQGGSNVETPPVIPKDAEHFSSLDPQAVQD